MQRLENPVVFATSVLGIIPHEPQARYLLDDHKTKVLVGGRRSGKTTSLAIEVCFNIALAYRDKRKCRQLLVAPSVDQAKLIFTTVLKMLKDSPLAPLIESEVQSPFPEIRLQYDSIVFVRAAHEQGKYLRGHSADRVVVDEASYLPDVVITESISPLLADTDGQLILASTPVSKGSLFHTNYEKGKTGPDPLVKSFHFKSSENPHISQDFVENQKKELSDLQFKTEYEGEFVDQTNSVFTWENIRASAVGSEKEPIAGHAYTIGYDPARKVDRSGVIVLDITNKPFEVVLVSDIHAQEYTSQVNHVAEISRRYGNAKVVIDQTSHGQVLLELLEQKNCYVEGLNFTQSSKADLIQTLVVTMERGEVTFPFHRDLIDELRFYERRFNSTGQAKYGAPEGSKIHDDLVTALALAIRGAGGITNYYTPDRFEMPFQMSSEASSSYPGIQSIVAGQLPTSDADWMDVVW